MNKKSIVVIIAVLGLGIGGATYFGIGSTGSGPFELDDNSTTGDSVEGIDFEGVSENGQLTQEAVALNTISRSSQAFEMQWSQTRQGERQTDTINYTTTESYMTTEIDTELVREKFYTERYAAVKNHQNGGSTLALEDPEPRAGFFVKESFLTAVVSSIGVKAQQNTVSDGDNEIVFRGDAVKSNSEELTEYYGVDEIYRVNTARVVTTEAGEIKQVELSVSVEDDGERYEISNEYTVTPTDGEALERPEWVTSAYDTNVGMNAFIPEDDRVLIAHKYGATLTEGDTINLRTPSGQKYTATVAEPVNPRTTLVMYQNNTGTYVMPVTEDMSIDGKDFVSSSGVYTLTVVSDDKGVLGVTTTRRS